MSEYLHNKIRKHATKQARRNHSVFPRRSANFLFRASSLARVDIQESDVLKLKEQLQKCVAIDCICSNSQVSKYQNVGIALQDFYE